MADISVARILASAQVGYKADMIRELKIIAAQIGTMVIQSAGSDGTVAKSAQRQVVANAGAILTRFFVGANGRYAYADDDVTPQSTYASILNKWYLTVTVRQIQAHMTWLKSTMPDDLFRWLQAATPPATRETWNVSIGDVQYVHVNALAQYDAMHTWVDPNGYRLSDRIWNTSNKSRAQLDALMTDLMRQGTSATEIAKLTERFIVPGRAAIRTKKPYGSDASYDAMRLGRTELAAASNRASLLAARMNPYVEAIDIARSANGDPTCEDCEQHASIGRDGGRKRQPYPLYSAPYLPRHPHCMCAYRPSVRPVKEVTEQLHQWYDEGQQAPVTAANMAWLLLAMFGSYLYNAAVSLFDF